MRTNESNNSIPSDLPILQPAYLRPNNPSGFSLQTNCKLSPLPNFDWNSDADLGIGIRNGMPCSDRVSFVNLDVFFVVFPVAVVVVPVIRPRSWFAIKLPNKWNFQQWLIQNEMTNQLHWPPISWYRPHDFLHFSCLWGSWHRCSDVQTAFCGA